MSNPRLAIWLYVAILLMAFMFSKRWGMLQDAVKGASPTSTNTASTGRSRGGSW